MRIFVYDTGAKSAFFNMGADEYALKELSVPVFRFYSWMPYAVSIGRFQRIVQIDSQKCKELGIEVVRRFTGGRAVLHKNDLSFSFALSAGFLPQKVEESYSLLTGAICYALGKLGLDAKLHASGSSISQAEPACASALWAGDVLVRSRKVAGSAQARQGKRVLQHGSVNVSANESELWGLLSVPRLQSRPGGEVLLSSNLMVESGGSIDTGLLKSLIIEGLALIFQAEVARASFGRKEVDIIESKYAKRYKDPAWMNRM